MPITFDDVSFETTCFGRDTATVASLDVERKLQSVAELRREVAPAGTLHPEEIGALLFQGARLVTASSGGELVGYAVARLPRSSSDCEMVVSPRAAGLPVGHALLDMVLST